MPNGIAYHLSRGVRAVQITQAALANLIQSDAQAKQLFEQQAFGDCAIRCCEIAPRVPKVLRLSKIGVLDVYMADRATGHMLLGRLAQLAETNPDAALMIEFMGPGNPESSYPDFGLPEIRMALTAPSPHGLGLTADQAAPMLAAGEQPDTITGEEIQRIAGSVP